MHQPGSLFLEVPLLLQAADAEEQEADVAEDGKDVDDLMAQLNALGS